MVYDTDSSKTFLDLRKAVKNFKDRENKFDADSLRRHNKPSYITELNNKILKEVKREFYEVESNVVDSTNLNNFIPVEQMSDGEMGISLNSLSLVIHKIFNQIYGLKERMDKGTQIAPGEIVLCGYGAEKRKKLDYLIRGLRGGLGKKKRSEVGGWPQTTKGRFLRGRGSENKGFGIDTTI